MRIAAADCVAACSIAAGCGGSSSGQEEPDVPTLEALAREFVANCSASGRGSAFTAVFRLGKSS